jgi:hypothetical protein
MSLRYVKGKQFHRDQSLSSYEFVKRIIEQLVLDTNARKQLSEAATDVQLTLVLKK